MTKLTDGVTLRFEAECEAELALVCWLCFDHDLRVRFGRARQLRRPCTEAETRGDVLSRSVGRGDAWELVYGFEIDTTWLRYEQPRPTPAEKELRADAAARLGHAFLNAVEIVQAQAH